MPTFNFHCEDPVTKEVTHRYSVVVKEKDAAPNGQPLEMDDKIGLNHQCAADLRCGNRGVLESE